MNFSRAFLTRSTTTASSSSSTLFRRFQQQHCTFSTTVMQMASYSSSSSSNGKFGCIGAGQMGTGIAVVAAMNAKTPVLLMDSNKESIERSKKFLDKLLSGYVKKEKITEEEKKEIASRIQYVDNLEALGEAGFVVEAIVEDAAVKERLFAELDRITPPETILATNTSSIPITRLAAATKRPEKVIGMHFMNPVPVMKLVEVIKGDHTAEETYEKTVQLAESMKKTTVLCKLDRAGFIANRLLMPYINEAVLAFEEDLATAEDIDTTMKLGCNMPMGPLTLADFIGLDTCLAIMRVLHEGLKSDKYKPCSLLEKMVSEGKLGKKSGEGFFSYDKK